MVVIRPGPRPAWNLLRQLVGRDVVAARALAHPAHSQPRAGDVTIVDRHGAMRAVESSTRHTTTPIRRPAHVI
jgi:hypothetical protein